MINHDSPRDFNPKRTTAGSFEELTKAWANLVSELTRLAEPLLKLTADSLGPPASVMDRALQARKNRNTGPAHPSAQNARRPRRHK